MLGLGRYLQHKKLSTTPDDDDDEDNNDVRNDESCSFGIVPQSHGEEDTFQVTFLGEEPIPKVLEERHQQVDSYRQKITEYINGPHFSPLNAMSRSQRVELTIGEQGIHLKTPTFSSASITRGGVSAKKCATTTINSNGSFTKSFQVPDLVYLSTEPSHKKVLVLICVSDKNQHRNIQAQSENCISVIVCQNESHPAEIIDLCSKRISPNPFSGDADRHCSQRTLVNKNRTYGVQHTLQLVYDQSVSVDGNHLLISDSETLKMENATKKSGDREKPPSGELDNLNAPGFFDELEDEFSKLAMKRNESLPEHLQNKGIKSLLLIDDTGDNNRFTPRSPSPGEIDDGCENQGTKRSADNKLSMTTKNKEPNNKSNFFTPSFYSSYSRVSSNGL